MKFFHQSALELSYFDQSCAKTGHLLFKTFESLISIEQHSAMRYLIIQGNILQYHAIPMQYQCNTIRYNSMSCSIIRCHGIQWNNMQFLTPKLVNFGNWCHTTTCRTAEWAPTGKPMVSRVTSGYLDVMIPLCGVRLRPKKVGYMGVV